GVALGTLLALCASLTTIPAAPPDRTTIVDLAVDAPDLSTLVAALVKADLVRALDGQRQFTVFAPTNDAFDAAAEAILGPGNDGIDLVDALSVMELTDVLLYHVAPGRRDSAEVVGSSQVRMTNKQFTFPSVLGSDVFINDAPILAVDLFADNGVVHVIGGVLLP
ncbi:MAG: fasciclin domain-containing protein, partial [Acidobacteriota bacterium]